MARINSILDRCVVEKPQRCLPSANELFKMVDETLAAIEMRTSYYDKNGNLLIPCRVSGKGLYKDMTPTGGAINLQASDSQGRTMSMIRVRYLVCNVCAHYALFAPGYPEETAARGWTPWTPPKG